ncbi:hypothetical protein [Flagellimonas halotolerans]|uniref:Uncharacterized protein n=1 Tax=Flagellimonas halotolerans TaxID=3112164 RepID=A0ABU6IL58_9FLAO|nr:MULTISPECIES: hypothetical protein [unclassified Allomuricauda]MEC3963972.1 hypothetical protein [Muricauda sp. SYSU M86414]MEC4263842.1 hypothetical protein [Muricauda sp. SYSU M84420]
MTVLRSLWVNGVDSKAVHIGNKTRERDVDVFVSNRRLFIEALKVPETANILHNSLNDPVMGKNLVRVFKLIGCCNLYDKLLDQCDCLINFNDHTPYNVILQEMAKEKRVKTVYIQHASVSINFPSLYHDYNILFSRDSFNKYKNDLGVKSYMLFDTRFSTLDPSDYKNEGTAKRVLICTNMLDDPNKVGELTDSLIDLGYTVTIRPHPADKRKVWGQLNTLKSENASIWEDVGDNGIVVANESSVVLEAIYLDRKVYKAAFFSDSFDNYGYLAQKLLLNQHFSVETLVDAIQKGKIEFNKDKLVFFIGELDNCKERLNNIIDDIKNDIG